MSLPWHSCRVRALQLVVVQLLLVQLLMVQLLMVQLLMLQVTVDPSLNVQVLNIQC